MVATPGTGKRWTMFITEKLQVCFTLSEVCTTVTAKTLGTSDQRQAKVIIMLAFNLI